MHASLVTATGSNQTVLAVPPTMKWASHAGSSQPCTQWNWAKAIGADEAEQGAPQAQVNVARAAFKTDVSKTTVKQLAQAIVGVPALNLEPVVASQKTAVTPARKQIVRDSSTSTQSVGAPKHKPASTPDETPAAAPAADPTDSAAVIALSAAPVAIPLAPITKVNGECKSEEKTGGVVVKRIATAATVTSGPPSNSLSENIPADAPPKPASFEEVKTKTVEVTPVAPQLAHAASITETSSIGILTSEVSATPHRPAVPLPAMLSPAEPRSIGATIGAPEPNTAHTLSAGPGQLEVGVLDATHGWLSIRTELGGNGAVNALLTSTATAHDSLRESIPAMAGYLFSEQVNVDRIVVGNVADGVFAGSNMAQSGHGSSHQQDRAPGSSSSSTNSAVGDGTPSTAAEGLSISGALFSARLPLFLDDGIGSWLSVTA